MERAAAAGTPLRRERGLVAPREGVITAPGLIPAEVPGVTFPSSRAVVSVASGGGGGGGGLGEREGAAPRGAAALRIPRREAGAARSVRRCGAASQFPPNPGVPPLLGSSAFSPPPALRHPPTGAPHLRVLNPGSARPGSHPAPCLPPRRPRQGWPQVSHPKRAGATAVPAPVNAESKQKSGRFKHAFETR